MPLLSFLLEAVLISLSGVMAPGPITAVTVGKGSDSPHAGALVAIGHGIVEFPLMISVFYGLGYLLDQPHVRTGIALVGGLFLLFMGLGMLRSVRRVEVVATHDPRSPVVVGILLSLGNPYFLVWWATVGATLILRSASYQVRGFLLFASLHWACDLVWLCVLSALSFKAGKFWGGQFQTIIFAICGLLLLFFSARYLMDAVRSFAR